MPDRIPDGRSDRMPDRMSEYEICQNMSDRMPDRMSEYEICQIEYQTFPGVYML